MKVVSDFKSIDIIFGTDCPLCALNMKKLWCEYNCSPQQSEFLKVMNVTRVRIGQQYYEALEAELHISLNATCNIYTSCRKIPEVTMM